jgi:hypothetical protein
LEVRELPILVSADEALVNRDGLLLTTEVYEHQRTYDQG